MQRMSWARTSEFLWRVDEMRIILEHTPEGGIVDIKIPREPDYRYSFMGSGLPLPSERSGFEGLTRWYRVRSAGRDVPLDDVVKHIPAWQYRNGSLKPPRALVKYVSEGRRIVTKTPILELPRFNHRSLTHPKLSFHAVAFDAGGSVLTQEARLRRRGHCLPEGLKKVLMS